jgi:LuxR family maltose regulon positive regulatory protein
MMTFSLHDSLQPNISWDIPNSREPEAASASNDEFHILREKLQVPSVNARVPRPRLARLLRRSRQQFPATLITGRAGTGKTALAAALARKTKNVSWYTVEATDADWTVFSRYLSESLTRSGIAAAGAGPGTALGAVSPGDIALFLLRHFFPSDAESKASSPLIVLDDIHHIFDAEWFEEFFNLLIYSLPREVHILMLCRSKPPAPMWRMRSKQMLNVLDEKEIAFDTGETRALFRSLGLSLSGSETARQKSFGRISKLLQLAR